MSTYTKGPWEVWEKDGIRAVGSSDYIVYHTVDYETMGVNGEANARLISSAPDLLEFIKGQRGKTQCVCRLNKIAAPFGSGIECTACVMDALIAKTAGSDDQL